MAATSPTAPPDVWHASLLNHMASSTDAELYQFFTVVEHMSCRMLFGLRAAFPKF